MSPPKHKRWLQSVPLMAFFCSAGILLVLYGLAIERYGLFPHRWIDTSLAAVSRGAHAARNELVRAFGSGSVPSKMRPWYYTRQRESTPSFIYKPRRAYHGLTFITGLAPRLKLLAAVVNMEGEIVHSWNVDWFRVWPNPQHLPPEIVPRSEPGTLANTALLRDGSIVVNYESIGLVRLDIDGNVMWRLPYRAHHTVHIHTDGTIWACGIRRRTNANSRFPYRKPPFDEYTVIEVSQDGQLLSEWSIPDLLLDNDMEGLLDLWWQPSSNDVLYQDDRLHLNDVEPFPEGLPAGLFGPGDVLVSFRNVNSVMVFNRRTNGSSTPQWGVTFTSMIPISLTETHSLSTKMADLILVAGYCGFERIRIALKPSMRGTQILNSSRLGPGNTNGSRMGIS